MDLKEIVWEGVDCTELAQDRDKWPSLLNKAMKMRLYKLKWFIN
jgi:hypothetical protein